MIRLGGLVSQKAFGKFEMGRVISNPFATAFIKEGEGEDHEVSMANNSLDTIIKMATELKAKMGENEKDIPAWIQDHITNAENFISQASSNYHEYGQNESRIAEDKGPCWQGYKQVGMKDKGGRQVPNCVPNESVVNEDINAIETLMLIRNLEQTNKLLVQDLKTSKGLSSNKKENIKKSIAINQGLINHYKEIFKNLKNNESVNEAKFKSPDYIISTTPASSLPPIRLAHADVSVGLKMADKLKNYTLNVRHFKLVHANGKVALKLTPEGKTAVRVRTENDPKYLQLIQKTVNDVIADYVSNTKESVNEASGRVPQIFLKTGAVEKKIKELMADRKKAVVPYNTEKDPKKKEILKQILIKLTKQIQGYEKNLIQLRDKEEEYIQQMQADVELDTSAFG